MLEKLIELFTRLVIACESIAKSLEGASVRPSPPSSTIPAPPPAPTALPTVPGVPAATPAPSIEDDLGLGPAAPPPAPTVTREQMMVVGRDKAASKGRDAVKAAMKTVGYDNLKDVKDADIPKMFATLSAL